MQPVPNGLASGGLVLRLIVLREEGLELAAQGKDGARRKVTERYGEVQMAPQPGVRGARAFTEHMDL